ncbi:nicotinamide riboside transporter PnuC [Dysgonomonas sp. 25]|uniref:nicotinamide riboside transporter PnuC n=1 Tax=Dysgonomonas sp. 25 TaxID=2302933 RepID=UPI0013D3909F|nr:nicotinamide riboside transporter PnuC [Dysgonomonas sp. 25]NDV67806.1 hypothetical protein [Dysgonomonas sp. 25]
MIDYITMHWISIVGTVLGLLYLYLEYKANIWMWLVGIGMAAFFVVIYYNTQLYASMVIYVYFLLGSIYGLIKWQRSRKNENTDQDIILRAPRKVLIPTITAIVVVGGIIYMLLITLSNNQGGVTIGDSVTTSLNVVALWLASRRWAEQWLLLIPANGLSAILLFIQQDEISAAMFAVYFVVSIFGYFNWKRLAKA